VFDDLIEANRRYRDGFRDQHLAGSAAKGLAVLTCIDSRIDPLAMLGLRPGDAKILRNAGARVTEDALRSLILATNLLDVTRICIVQHTDCAMSGVTDDELRARIAAATGHDASGLEPRAATIPHATLKADIATLRRHELIPATVEVAGFLYDVHTGALAPSR
jgi:carbonic anhydrase